MTPDKAILFETLMNAYSLGRMQDFSTYLKTLASKNLTIEDHEAYIAYKIDWIMRKEKRLQHLHGMKRCPLCNGPMSINPVNVSRGTQTGDDSKFVWTCISCMEQIFVKEI